MLYKKYFSIFITIFSIIGYGYFAFAVINPGDTLDPVADNLCTGPNDPACLIVFPSAISEIERGTGAPTSTPTGSDPIFYIDESNGDVYSWDSSQWNVLGSGGGSGPFSIVNGNSIFSTGLADTGLNSTATDSFFVGDYAGLEATNATHSNFLGNNAGYYATNASYSNFLGNFAGQFATDAYLSNFLGYYSGQFATDAYLSNFLGNFAGQNAANASYSNFLGFNAGQNAFDASDSNFLGSFAGQNAANAYQANFLGGEAGTNAANAAKSIFIGRQAGFNDTVDNTLNADDYSILLGNYTSTGGFSNSIAMGAYATNTATNQFMMGSSARPINDLIINGTGSLFLPVGDDSQRTAYATDGAIRYNTDQGCFEMYSSSAWACLGGGGSGPFSIVNGNSIFSTGLTDTGLNSSVTDSFFVGDYAGYEATSAFASNFIGSYAGYSAIDAALSNFLGSYAGYGAINANSSNFLGFMAGYGGINAAGSNFLGNAAGYDAVNASASNFIGQQAGYNAIDAYNSNFFGTNAGYNALNALASNFFGGNTGDGATNAFFSNFFGTSAGYGAINASNAIFIGSNSGYNDIVDNTSGGSSILIGDNTGTGGFSNSIALGAFATNTATNQFMIGSSARSINDLIINGTGSLFLPVGDDSQRTSYASDGALRYNTDQTCLEMYASSAWSCLGGGGSGPVVLGSSGNTLYTPGLSAGEGDVTFGNNIFLGSGAGESANNAYNSIFLGVSAGAGATDAYQANFLGFRAGDSAINAVSSNMFGNQAGDGATNASYSNIFGHTAGYQAVNASNSIFIGNAAGYLDTVDNFNTGGWSILLGPSTNTGGFSNSIALGGNAINTAADQFMLADSITNVRWRGVEYFLPSTQAGGVDYVLTNDGSGNLAWSDPALITSDEILKSNITDLSSNILDSLSKVRTVSYVLNNDPSQRSQIGFIAQDLQSYFPELVGTRTDGYFGVYYAQMTPILTKAIQELDLKIQNIQSASSTVVVSSGFSLDTLRTWLGDVGNGIQKIFAKQIKTEELCIGATCVTESQLIQLLNQNGQINNNQSNNNTSPNNDSSSDNNGEQQDQEIQEPVSNSDENSDISEEMSPEEPFEIISDQETDNSSAGDIDNSNDGEGN